MRDNLIRTNIVLTKKLRKAMEMEANRKCAGNMSMLTKLILAKRYSLEKEIPAEFRYMLEDI